MIICSTNIRDIIVLFLLLSHITPGLTQSQEHVEQKQRSFDLNVTASSEKDAIGGVEVEEEVNSRLQGQSRSPDRSTIEWINKKSRRAKRPRTAPIQPISFKSHTSSKYSMHKSIDDIMKNTERKFRYYGDGKNLSGLTKDGKDCETHHIGCPHWINLDHKTRRLHSTRLSQRRLLEKDGSRRQKAREKSARWYRDLKGERKIEYRRNKRKSHQLRFERLSPQSQQERKEKNRQSARESRLRKKLKKTNARS